MIPIEIGIALIIVACAYAFLYIKIALIHRSVMMDKVKKMQREAEYLKYVSSINRIKPLLKILELSRK